MKKFEITFIKQERLSLLNSVAKLAKQTIFSDSDELLIIPPKGYTLMQVEERLPDIQQTKDKKYVNGRKEN